MKKHAQWTPGKKARIALLAALVAAGPALAKDVVKANNTDDLNLTTSWSGGNVPTASNVAVWDNTSANGTFQLGADLAFQGVRIGNPGGKVIIQGANTLTLGSAGIQINNRNLDIVPEIILSSTQTWTVSNGFFLDSNSNLNTGGVSVNNQGYDLEIHVVAAENLTWNYANLRHLEGSGNLTLTGLGRVRYTGTYDNFTGNIAVNSGVFTTLDTTLTLGGGQSLGGAGTVRGDVSFGSGATLDFDPAQTLTVTGALSFDNSFGVASLNVADWSLIGEDTYTLISNGGDFSNITNWGAGNAATLSDGRQAYFKEGSLQLVVIPEPSTLVLFGLALLSVAAFRKRR